MIQSGNVIQLNIRRGSDTCVWDLEVCARSGVNVAFYALRVRVHRKADNTIVGNVSVLPGQALPAWLPEIPYVESTINGGQAVLGPGGVTFRTDVRMVMNTKLIV